MKNKISIHKSIIIFTFLFLIFGCKKGGTTIENPLILPSLNTDVTNVTKNSARFGSWIQSDGGAAITSKGFCYSTSPNPTTSSNTIAGVGNDDIYATVTGLNSSTTYYVKSYATNNNGTGYGEQEEFTTMPAFSIGETYQGGVIFYLDSTGLHGLIRTESELANIYIWGCLGTNIPGTINALGSGQSNTTAILNLCSSAETAAKACDDLVVNGYSDWFLPSRVELNKMCPISSSIRYYWASTQVSNNTAVIVGFEHCSTDTANTGLGQPKDLREWVWPIRKF